MCLQSHETLCHRSCERRKVVISEQALSQSGRVTNLDSIKHSGSVSVLDDCTFQLAGPRVGQNVQVGAVGEVGE